MSIKSRIETDLKEAMRAREQRTVSALRLVTAAVKQVEVDERIVVDDTRMLVILDKLVKQRQEAIAQYQAAHRAELEEQETFELNLIKKYLPTPLSSEEIAVLIAEAIREVGAETMRDMGKVMTYLKPSIQGRADSATVSALIKEKLQ